MRSPEKFVKDMGLKSSEGLAISIIDEVVKANPSEYQRIKDEEKLLTFFVGRMKLTKEKSHQIINKIFKEEFNLSVDYKVLISFNNLNLYTSLILLTLAFLNSNFNGFQI